MIQKCPQPQLVLIIIAIPIRNVTSPTGANTFSPMNAACFATVTIPSGSRAVCARIAWIMIETPPPTQITAKSTCTALKSEYQLFGSAVELENAKIAPTTTTAPRMA